MRYFSEEDYNKCVEFLKCKPEAVEPLETQQELYKFMHEECKMVPAYVNVTAKNMSIYSKIYATRFNPETANWCATMSDGSQVVWNRKYKLFYRLRDIDTDRCDCFNYLAVFPDLKSIDMWLLENWLNWRFQETQKQLIAIWNGKFNMSFKNFWS